VGTTGLAVQASISNIEPLSPIFGPETPLLNGMLRLLLIAGIDTTWSGIGHDFRDTPP